MHAPSTIPLLRRLMRVVAYLLFQLALLLAYVLRSVGTLRLPLHFSHAAADAAPTTPLSSRRTRPRSRFSARPAL